MFCMSQLPIATLMQCKNKLGLWDVEYIPHCIPEIQAFEPDDWMNILCAFFTCIGAWVRSTMSILKQDAETIA